MTDLHRKRCANHQAREAAARCPACGRFFCRECVTEHDGRMLCSGCITALSRPKPPAGPRFAVLSRTLLAAAGLILSWSIFYYLGRLLILLPTAFHDGTLWQSGWWGDL